MYSWWWVELSPETCRVKPLRRINAIFASCWIYFTIPFFVFPFPAPLPPLCLIFTLLFPFPLPEASRQQVFEGDTLSLELVIGMTSMNDGRRRLASVLLAFPLFPWMELIKYPRNVIQFNSWRPTVDLWNANNCAVIMYIEVASNPKPRQP